MHETTFTFAGEDGTPISALKWTPDGDPKAIVQILHGMAEHSGRYRRLGEALTGAGYVAYTYDHRGHGKTSPDNLGEFEWPSLVGDIGSLAKLAREENPGLKLVILGHSMGSFALQTYLLDHSADIDGAVLSGTTAVDMVMAGLDLEADMDMTAFNMGVEEPRTGFDWLSRDPDEVDKYIEDAACGFSPAASSLSTMISVAPSLGDPERLAGIESSLPVYLLSGDADPLAVGGMMVQMVADRYRQAGVVDVTVDLYPGARHELFNETNRDEVTDKLVAWLDRVTA
jgi:alpha-beta hydrolase superfamily lysophospholipase